MCIVEVLGRNAADWEAANGFALPLTKNSGRFANGSVFGNIKWRRLDLHILLKFFGNSRPHELCFIVFVFFDNLHASKAPMLSNIEWFVPLLDTCVTDYVVTSAKWL